jgi:hypothetical protein
MIQHTLPTMADQHECPVCGEQAWATGRRGRRVNYECECGLEFEVMTPGSGSAYRPMTSPVALPSDARVISAILGVHPKGRCRP